MCNFACMLYAIFPQTLYLFATCKEFWTVEPRNLNDVAVIGKEHIAFTILQENLWVENL